jgi:hypothetical protein
VVVLFLLSLDYRLEMIIFPAAGSLNDCLTCATWTHSLNCLNLLKLGFIWLLHFHGSDVHAFNTRFNHDLHFPVVNLTIFQKGVWFSGIKLYNHLPSTLKQLSYSIPKFKVALKRFLTTKSFYTVEEYYC